MIAIETIEYNILKLEITGMLDEADFQKIGSHIDELIKIHGSVRLLIDATHFDGWDSAHAAAAHFEFVRDHHKKIDQIALVASRDWQHWIAGVASVFVHPQIQVFDKDGIVQAESWLTHRRAA